MHAELHIERLEMVIIFVTDVEKSVQWYQDTLGMSLVSRHGDFATLKAGESRIALHGGAIPEADLRNAGSMPVFKVAAYAAAKKGLESKGCDFVFENSTPASIFGTFLDPDGNPLQIMETR
jgi:catechol 2,3-dioxygenase-like lactoylglutathione lyase family enzyme